jgi:hypothetical protein
LPAAVAVDCAGSHTAELLAVVKGSNLTPASAFQRCQAAAVTYVATTRPEGLAASNVALPRSAQLSVYVSRNAKRAYCVGFSTSAKGSVTRISGSVKGTGLVPHVCFNGRTWAERKCSARTIPITGVAWLSKSPSQRYPGDGKVLAKAQRACIKTARAAGLMAKAWYVQGSTQWNLGNHYALCDIGKDETDSGWVP